MRGRLWERELDTDRESFEARVTRFSEFYWAERYPKKIICVWPEDILARRKRFVQVGIFKTVVVELADNFELGLSQFDLLFLGCLRFHSASVPPAAPAVKAVNAK